MKKKIIIAATIAVSIAVLGLVVFLAISSSKQKKHSESREETQGDKDGLKSASPINRYQTASPEKSLMSWNENMQYVYTFDFVSSLFMESSTDYLYRLSLKGILEANVVQSNSKLFIRMRDLKIEVENGVDEKMIPSAYDELSEQFARGFLISFDNSGRVQNIGFSEKAPGMNQSIVKSCASMFQFVRPEKNPLPESWRTKELDTTGLHFVDYERDSDSNYRKSKTEYIKLSAVSNASHLSLKTMQATILKSDVGFTISSQKELQHLAVHECIRLSGSSVLAQTEAETEFSLDFHEKKLNPGQLEELAALTADFVTVPIDSPLTDEARQRQMDTAKISGMNLKAALEILAANSGNSQEEKNKKQRVFVGMEALFRRQPASILEAKSHIIDGHDESKMMITALGYANTRESQAALIELFNGADLPNVSQKEILRSLSLSGKPTEDNIQLHKSLLSDSSLGAQARYGLGTLINRVGSEDSKSELELLIQALQDANTDIDRIVVLRALGNAGAPASLQYILPYVESNNADLRKAALDAIRRIPGPEVDEIIVSRMLADLDAAVRIKAMQMMTSRTALDLFAVALEKTVKTDASSVVREKAVATLVRLPGLAQEAVVEILNWVIVV